ncbi:MAG: nuclear transport factor 2 family protein [Solobacterium sp.]|nr:nuclear transport factor 2 family protein [Solobacterium sp.]
MNYVETYVNFYSGENKKQIYRMVDRFCQAVRTGALDELDDMLSDDCVVDVSMVGRNITGSNAIKEAFTWPGEEMDIRKFNIFSYVCRIHENEGRIYFYNQAIVAKDDGVNVFPFTFGGHFAMHVIKADGVWKFKRIKYDLCFEQGNNSFVRGKWKLMNYGQANGHFQSILHYEDSPWITIPVDDEPGDEMEQRFQDEFKTAYSMDMAATDEIYANAAEPVDRSHMKKATQVRKNTTKGGGLSADLGADYSALGLMNFNKEKLHKEARLIHTYVYGSYEDDGHIRVTGNVRSEYNRLYNKVFNRENIHSLILTVFQPRSEINVDGNWLPYDIGFDGRVVFVPIDDDCIRFDPYFCGGETWLEKK